MRSNLDNNRARGLVIESMLKVRSIFAISANQVLVAGMPMVLAYDPANTTRTITMEAITAASEGLEKEIWNLSTGTGSLTILNPSAATIATVPPGGKALLRVMNQAWVAFVELSGVAAQTVGARSVLSFYTTHAFLGNGTIIGAAIPFDFTVISTTMRVKNAVTTAAKAATLTTRINGVACTGGVLSLTSANQTPNGNAVAATAITALNTGTAGQVLDTLTSGVTAFVEGEGYLEFVVQNRNLAA